MHFNHILNSSILGNSVDRFGTRYDVLFVVMVGVAFTLAIILTALVESGKNLINLYRRGSLPFGWLGKSVRLGLTSGIVSILTAVAFHSVGYTMALRFAYKREAKEKVAFLEAVAQKHSLADLRVYWHASTFEVFYDGRVPSQDAISLLKKDLALLMPEADIQTAIRHIKIEASRAGLGKRSQGLN